MKNWRIGAAVVLAAGAACGFEAHAQVDEAAAKVLKDSAAAIEKTQGVTYQSKLYGVGALKDIMDGEGEVTQVRVDLLPGKKPPARIKGAVKELGKGKTPFTVATDGAVVEWIDDPQNTHFKRPVTDRNDAQRVLSLGSQVVLGEFTEVTPYAKQLKAPTIELKPNEQVRGVDCRVILVSWESGLRSEMWWIGAQDNLPRKIEMAHGQNRDLAKGTEIWDLKVLDKADLATLAIATPPGYKQDFQTAAPAPIPQPPVNPNNNVQVPPPPVVGLAPGTAAPEFDLKSADGSSVKLSSTKGSVVVLTFGGSRFPKTDTVNSMVSEIAAANKASNVQAYTLACREESDQAATDHAKKVGNGVKVLLGADNVKNDYKVAGFPFTYVLTADGRVSKAFQGAVTKDQLEKAVAAAIKGEIAELPKAGTPAPAPALAPVTTQLPGGTVKIKPNPDGTVPNISPTKK